MTQWQTIDRAPKDGRPILITGGTFTHENGDYPDFPLDFVTIGHRHKDEYVDGVYVYKPTYWMPLPDAPNQ